MILVNDEKYIHLLRIFFTFQSFSYCKVTIHKFIPVLLILLQMAVKLFLAIE